jgi:CubicO group peptidase (beta-lactamase class C family)
MPNASRKKSAYKFPAPPQFVDPARREKLANAFPEIRRVFVEHMETQHIPGITYGILIDHELVEMQAMGVRNVESNTPVTENTVFRIASMSKSFVAMAVLRLRDAKKLRLDDLVAKYIPELKNLLYPTTDSPELTIRHLLTMSPGFPEDNPWGDRQMAITERQFTQWLKASIPFSNAPNVTFEYSNYAFAILGRIVSRIAGIPFQTYITRHILKPLGMDATVWDAKQVTPEQLALGYRFEDEQLKPEPILPNGAFAGMAGIFTTISDFARYMDFLLDAFPPRDDVETGPVKRATAREMQQLARYEELVERKTSTDTPWHSVSGYGFGLAVWHDELLGYGVAHGGGLPGYGSYYYLLPHHGVGVVAFGNKTYARVGMLFPQILELLSRTGGLAPRVVRPAAELVELQGVVQRWLEGGDDGELLAHAADNFVLDRDLPHRRAEQAKIRGDLGEFVQVGKLEPWNALRGRWIVECERGTLDVFLTLAPTQPLTIQMLSLTPRPKQ